MGGLLFKKLLLYQAVWGTCVLAQLFSCFHVLGAHTLEVECRCYLPQKNGASVNDDTERSVREYTRHVLCLVTDLVDRVIKRRGVLAVVSQNSPLNAGLCSNQNLSQII